MNRLAAEQCRRNRSRDDHWHLSTHHRANVTGRILSLAGDPYGRLCVLGAGNANDLDLPALLATYAEVSLVDIDGDALLRGARRQGVAEAALRLYGGVDVTRIWDSLEKLPQGDAPAESELERLVQRAGAPDSLDLPGPFDVVVSAGLVSQLIEAVATAAPLTFPRCMDLLLAVRSGHLRLLAGLTAPSGRGLLITDFVSSATLPELPAASDAEIEQLAGRLAAERNFFHGLNPVLLPHLFERDAMLQRLVAATRHRGYWRWDQRPRSYAVLAIEFLRSAAIADKT